MNTIILVETVAGRPLACFDDWQTLNDWLKRNYGEQSIVEKSFKAVLTSNIGQKYCLSTFKTLRGVKGICVLSDSDKPLVMVAVPYLK